MPHPYNPILIKQLKRHEGFYPSVYLCPAGKRTIGYGTNIDANPVPGITDESVINKEQAERLMIAELMRLESQLLMLEPWVRNLDDVRYSTLLNMVYNIGVAGVRKFVRALDAMELDDWSGAAKEMLHSKWAGQVKGRAVDLANQMSTGLWCPKDDV